MLIALILILTLLEIALQVSLVGMELSYQVSKRLLDIKSKTDVAIAEASKDVLSEVEKDTTFAENTIDTLATTSVAINKTVKTTLSVAVPVIKTTTKTIIRLLKFVVSLIRNILVVFSAVYIVVEIVVFVLLAIVSYSYLSI